MVKFSGQSIAKAIGFATIGILLAILHVYLTNNFAQSGLIAHLFPSVVAPSLVAVAALPSWRIQAPDAYWKAPLLCAAALGSWSIINNYLWSFLVAIFDRPGLFWVCVEIAAQGAVEAFAMFAFIFKATVLYRSRKAAIAFIVIAAFTNLIFVVIGILLFGSLADGTVAQYALLLAVVALAAEALPHKAPEPRVPTVMVESA